MARKCNDKALAKGKEGKKRKNKIKEKERKKKGQAVGMKEAAIEKK